MVGETKTNFSDLILFSGFFMNRFHIYFSYLPMDKIAEYADIKGEGDSKKS